MLKIIMLLGFPLFIMHNGFVRPSFAQDDMEIIGLNKIYEKDLVDRVLSYYRLEKTKSWQETYTYRPESFRKSVPYYVYERIMDEDSSGYNLYKIEIDIVEREYQEGGMVPVFYIWANFFELITDKNKLTGSGFANIYDTGDVHAGSDRMIWILEDDQWKCAACGVRAHMTLNAQMD